MAAVEEAKGGPLDLGIDFGTTRTVVACADRGNHPVVGFQDASGDAVQWIPTIVAEKDGELLLRARRRRQRRGARRPLVQAARSRTRPGPSKRSGSVPRRSRWPTWSRASSRTCATPSSSGRTCAGRSAKGGLRAAVAVPANAHSAQRLITLDAFRRAGFDSVAMLNEPSAAGFEYTHRHRDTLSSKRDVVGVYDLGGRHVRRLDRPDERAPSRGPRHGGHRAPRRRRLRQGAGRRGPRARRARPRDALDGATLDRLLDHCRVAKESLNPASKKMTIDLEAALGARAPRSEITRARSPTSTTRALRSWSDARRDDPADDAHGRGGRGAVARRHRRASTSSAERASSRSSRARCASASAVASTDRPIRRPRWRSGCRSPPTRAQASSSSTATRAPSASSAKARADGRSPSTRSSRPTRRCRSAQSERLTETRAYRAAHNVGHFRFFECGAVDGSGRPRGDMTLYGDVYFPFDRALRGDRDLAGRPHRATRRRGPPGRSNATRSTTAGSSRS